MQQPKSKSIAAVAIPAAILGLVSCAPSPASGPATGNAELAGRIEGAPQRCVSINASSNLRISGSGDLLYGSGETIWLSRVPGGCRASNTDMLVTEAHGSQYCQGDPIRTVDRYSGIPGPSCILGPFVPYRRP